MKHFVISLAALIPMASALATTPVSCQYDNDVLLKGKDNGSPTRLYQQVGSSWYGKYKQIQFCTRPDGAGQYILIEEELIHGMKVLNPPQEILSESADSAGTVADEINTQVGTLTFKTSADHKQLQVIKSSPNLEGGVPRLVGTLELVWSKETK